MIRITFNDGSSIDLLDGVTLVGFNNSPIQKSSDCYYVKQEYSSASDNGQRLSTTDNRIGIAGFLLSHDCFCTSESSDSTMFFSSAVKSISII